MTRVSLSFVPLRENVQRSKSAVIGTNTHRLLPLRAAFINTKVGYCVLILTQNLPTTAKCGSQGRVYSEYWEHWEQQ